MATLQAKIEEIEKRSAKSCSCGSTDAVKGIRKMLLELERELGFSRDEYDILDRKIPPDSALGRLQLQIDSLVEVLDLEETWAGGKLRYEKKG